MNPLHSANNPSTANTITTEPSSTFRPWRYKRELILAFVLLVASHIFVMMFAKAARWELDLTGGSKLTVPQLERCRDGNAGTPDEFCQMDCCWYSSIIRSGYDKDPVFGGGYRANWAFFPLFPLFAAPWFRIVGIESTHAAVLASTFSLYFAILAFLLMVRSESYDFNDTVLAGSLVAFNPGITFAHGGYAEPLYFALAAAGFALLDRRRWMSAGLAGGLLSATRPTGIVFVVAYVISAVRSGAVLRLFRDRRLGVLIGALLCPVGLSVWMLFMYHRTGDALAWMHMHAAWGVSLGNPLVVLWDGWRNGGWLRFWSCLTIAGWAVSAWLVAQRQYEKAAFLALAILVPSTAEVAGMPRFVWWQPPTLYAAFLLLKRHPKFRAVYFVFTGGMAALLTLLWFLGGRSVV